MTELHAIQRYRTITLDLRDRVAHIRLNRPPLNIITVEVSTELEAAMEECNQRPEVAAIVFSGAGDNFSAGVDVAAHAPNSVRQMLVSFHSAVRAVVNSRKVTIAAVHGNCLGGGAELASACDLVFTTDDATWGFPEITLGAFPPVAAATLAAIIGPKRAAELILTGRKIDGEEATRIGLANEAASPEEVAELVEETAERVSTLSPAVLALTKKALSQRDATAFRDGLDRVERIYLEDLSQLEDAREGVQAFLEKRPPAWKGK
jgi:cyclohexa-1,5-dienecarbonyl-CoA hydratase